MQGRYYAPGIQETVERIANPAENQVSGEQRLTSLGSCAFPLARRLRDHPITGQRAVQVTQNVFDMERAAPRNIDRDRHVSFS